MFDVNEVGLKPVMTEAELIAKIFERYPDLVNVKPLAWCGGIEVPTNDIIGIAVVPRTRFDAWHHLPIRDDELRREAQLILAAKPTGRFNCLDDDAVLVLTVLQ